MVLRPRTPKLDPWEHALTCPLPQNTSFELLTVLREHVLTYLGWVTADLVQGNDDSTTQREIQRAADRLKVIAAMTPAALAAAVDADLARFRANADAEREAQTTPPPPLPELTQDEIKRSGYGQPFSEASTGTERLEILLRCKECDTLNTFDAWTFSGRLCPDCGSNRGAVKE